MLEFCAILEYAVIHVNSAIQEIPSYKIQIRSHVCSVRGKKICVFNPLLYQRAFTHSRVRSGLTGATAVFANLSQSFLLPNTKLIRYIISLFLNLAIYLV